MLGLPKAAICVVKALGDRPREVGPHRLVTPCISQHTQRFARGAWPAKPTCGHEPLLQAQNLNSGLLEDAAAALAAATAAAAAPPGPRACSELAVLVTAD